MLRPRAAAPAGAVLMLSLVLLSPGRSSAGVNGTPHDMTSFVADPFRGACSFCHVVHKAQGERLWVQSAYGPATGWGSRPIAALCYMCHQSGGGGFNASDMSARAFNGLSHGYEVAKMPPAPDGSAAVPAGLPYVLTGLLDCTTCHDPHGNIAPFIREGGIDQLCKKCHGRENQGAVGGVNSFTISGSGAAFSLHPTDVPHEDSPANGVTNLREYPATLQVPTASGSWMLGGHRIGWQPGAGNIGCQTCHAVHGWKSYPEGRAEGFGSSLTAIENGGSSSAPLCEACHAGGGDGETVGTGKDHPVNRNDGIPPTKYPEGWPAGPAAEITCSSCHDAHGGSAGTSLVRQGGSAEGWCWSCHDRPSLVPGYHHSTKGNDGLAGFTSILDCVDCHGDSQGLRAHNGFMALQVVSATNSSAICEACHVPANPLALDAAAYQKATGRSRTFDGAVQPSLHGTPAGASSHLVDAPDDDSIANCQLKRTPWSSGGVSRYGSAGEVICESCHGVLVNAGVLLGAGAEQKRVGGWKANLLLEPYEDNGPGVGIESPDNFPGPTLSALCRGCHYSTAPEAEPSFVHNPSAHTVDGYLYPEAFTPYGRATRRVMTTPGEPSVELCPEVSSADRAGAPGRFSYPAPDQMDCDSCHRPHGAHDAAEDGGIRRILEFTAALSHGTTPCLECHDTDRQCGSE